LFSPDIPLFNKKGRSVTGGLFCFLTLQHPVLQGSGRLGVDGDILDFHVNPLVLYFSHAIFNKILNWEK